MYGSHLWERGISNTMLFAKDILCLGVCRSRLQLDTYMLITSLPDSVAKLGQPKQLELSPTP